MLGIGGPELRSADTEQQYGPTPDWMKYFKYFIQVRQATYAVVGTRYVCLCVSSKYKYK